MNTPIPNFDKWLEASRVEFEEQEERERQQEEAEALRADEEHEEFAAEPRDRMN